MDYGHYQKYRDISTALPTEAVTSWFAKHLPRLRELYDADAHLNNIPLGYFDSNANAVRQYIGGGHALSECVCVQKHVLIYKVLGVEPPADPRKDDEIENL